MIYRVIKHLVTDGACCLCGLDVRQWQELYRETTVVYEYCYQQSDHKKVLFNCPDLAGLIVRLVECYGLPQPELIAERTCTGTDGPIWTYQELSHVYHTTSQESVPKARHLRRH